MDTITRESTRIRFVQDYDYTLDDMLESPMASYWSKTRYFQTRDAGNGMTGILDRICEGTDSVADIVQAAVDAGAVRVYGLFVYRHSSTVISISKNLIGLSEEDVREALTVRGSAAWDTSVAGFVVVEQATIDSYGTPEERIDVAVNSEINEINEWFSNGAWGYVIEKRPEGLGCIDNDCCFQEVEAVWGYVGEDYVRDEAFAAAGWPIES